MAETEQPQVDQTASSDPSSKKSIGNVSFSIWPPTQRTRDAVINRLIETLSSPSVLSKRYGVIPTGRRPRPPRGLKTRPSRLPVLPPPPMTTASRFCRFIPRRSLAACSILSSPDLLPPLLMLRRLYRRTSRRRMPRMMVG
nr:uncharacterized protein LOC113713450 [Coffea arabica]